MAGGKTAELFAMSQDATNPNVSPSAELLQVVYVSSASEPWRQEDLLKALAKFRENNVRRGITGMLLHHDGNFMQAIEGPPSRINALERRIAADPRHFGFIALLKRRIPAREFAGWSMAFRNVGDQDASTHPGWSDFLGRRNGPVPGPDVPGRALRLLHSFRDSIRA
jgi:hypothetical protein